MRFGDALKQFRRQAHVHQHHWHAVVLCEDEAQANMVWEEAVLIMQNSSMSRELQIYHSRRTMDVGKGATIRFIAVGSMADLDVRIKGLPFTHILWMYDPDGKEYALMELQKRSRTLEPSDLLTVRAEF